MERAAPRKVVAEGSGLATEAGRAPSRQVVVADSGHQGRVQGCLAAQVHQAEWRLVPVAAAEECAAAWIWHPAQTPCCCTEWSRRWVCDPGTPAWWPAADSAPACCVAAALSCASSPQAALGWAQLHPWSVSASCLCQALSFPCPSTSLASTAQRSSRDLCMTSGHLCHHPCKGLGCPKVAAYHTSGTFRACLQA